MGCFFGRSLFRWPLCAGREWRPVWVWRNGIVHGWVAGDHGLCHSDTTRSLVPEGSQPPESTWHLCVRCRRQNAGSCQFSVRSLAGVCRHGRRDRGDQHALRLLAHEVSVEPFCLVSPFLDARVPGGLTAGFIRIAMVFGDFHRRRAPASGALEFADR